MDCNDTGNADVPGIWRDLCCRIFQKKAFSLVYADHGGSHFSDSGRDVFLAAGGKLCGSHNLDGTWIHSDDAGAVGQRQDNMDSGIVLCSLGILHLVSGV